MKRKTEFIQVLTTVENKRNAEKIAAVLSRKRLSACTQIIGPISSVYRWKGKTEKSREWLCIAKTEKSKYKKAENAIKELHSYDVPEIIAVPIVRGSDEYLRWLHGVVSQRP